MRTHPLSIQTPSVPTLLNPAWGASFDVARHRLLGLDVGTKTIGLALASPGWQIVTPLVTLQRGKNWTVDLGLFAKALADFPIHGIIVGLPFNMDGSEGPRAQSIRQTASNLAEAQPSWLHGPGLIGFWDERLSTAAVTRFMIDERDTSRAKRAEIVDALAAQHILQGATSYLLNHNR